MTEVTKILQVELENVSEIVGSALWTVAVLIEEGYELSHPQKLTLHGIAVKVLEQVGEGGYDWLQALKDLQALQTRLITSAQDPMDLQRLSRIAGLVRRVVDEDLDDDLYQQIELELRP